MIAVDASALLAILLHEAEAEQFAEILTEAGGGLISPINFWEVLVRSEALRSEPGREDAERLVREFDIAVAIVTAKQARLAADAFRRFGKRSAAGLNLGDCFAYALAVEQGDGLLFKGDDFAKTDVKAIA